MGPVLAVDLGSSLEQVHLSATAASVASTDTDKQTEKTESQAGHRKQGLAGLLW